MRHQVRHSVYPLFCQYSLSFFLQKRGRMWYNTAAPKLLHLCFMRLSPLSLLALSLLFSPLPAQEENELTPETGAVAAEAGAQADEESREEPAAAESTDAAQMAPDASDETAAEALVTTLKTRFSSLAELLSQVQDAESAAALQPEVRERFNALLTTDAAALADADEEELAAEFAEAFVPIDAELARLEEADFFGCEDLRSVFAEGDEPAEDEEGNYIFPLGPLDFLRGNKAQERHVCPRHEGGLQLMDWSQE